MDYINAHKFSMNHKKQLLQDKKCGCFHCLEIFEPSKIESWIKDTDGTGLCPYCGVDAIIGEYSGYPITKEFLKEMNSYWFGSAKQ